MLVEYNLTKIKASFEVDRTFFTINELKQAHLLTSSFKCNEEGLRETPKFSYRKDDLIQDTKATFEHYYNLLKVKQELKKQEELLNEKIKTQEKVLGLLNIKIQAHQRGMVVVDEKGYAV